MRLIVIIFILFPSLLFGKVLIVSSVHKTVDGEKTFSTIQKAINISENGDTIQIMSGMYFEKLKLRNKDNLTIVPYGDGYVQILGAIKEFFTSNMNSWTFIREESNAYFNNKQYVYKIKLPDDIIKENKNLPEWYAGFNQVYDIQKNELFGYRTKNEFDTRTQINSEGEGFYFTGTELFIAINQNTTDRFQKFIATVSGFTIRIQSCKNLTLDGGQERLLNINYGGRYAIGAEGNISELKISNINFSQNITGIYLHNINGKTVTITSNNFTNKLDKKWIWSNIKSSLLESTAIGYTKGSVDKLVINKNNFHGVFNGIISLPGNTHIQNNNFENIGDDAVELEGLSINSIVKNNIFINCFTAFSLCPVREGPVYIYNNIIKNNIEEFPFQLLKDGSIRMVKPKTLKFWNLLNGDVLKDGKYVFLSTNCHFYHNTIISKNEPFTIGSHSVRYANPSNSTFYNNVFLSEGILTNSTGFVDDGIDIDNNIFYSTLKEKSEPRLFKGWNGKNHYEMLKNTSSWNGNKYLKIQYDKDFNLCKKSKRTMISKYSTKLLPNHYPGSEYLNKRAIAGYQPEKDD